MPGPSIKTLSARFVEALIALLLVLGAFAVIMLLVNNLFPSGRELAGTVDGKASRIAADGQDLLISGGGYDGRLMDPEELAAVLEHTRRTVKRKPSDGIAWKSVSDGTPLFDLDAVQTFKGAGAQIVFDRTNRLTMGENSLVIIQRMEKDVFRNERRSQVVVVDGELSGTVAAAGGAPVRVEVATASAVAKVDSGDGEASFSVKVNADKSSTVTVLSGRAELVGERGAIVIEANQSATAEADGVVQEAVPLPGRVGLLQPGHGRGVRYRDLPPRLTFTWREVADATGYRFQLAGDAEFERPLVDEVVSDNRFMHGNLHHGGYFWRVRAVREWAEGPYAPPYSLRVTQDTVPPSLAVDFPPRFSVFSRVTLTGVSERNARVSVDGQDVALTRDGRFSHDIELQQGVNVLVVEAADDVGNVTYQSAMVYGNF